MKQPLLNTFHCTFVPTPPPPYADNIGVQDLNDFHDIASHKCRPDGYKSQITLD